VTRRSKLEIMVNVLNIIQNGETKPTRIMYGANLSWKVVKGVLESLVHQGLVESTDVSEGSRRDKRTSITYVITSEGQNVLRYFQSVSKLVDTESNFNLFQVS
jgi:predicted transcriptional regulator